MHSTTSTGDMPGKPIFVATHPRACSTAFERVFMTCRDTLTCIHEPFGDAFYYGPERLSPRFENDEKAREESGFANSTYQTVFDRIEREGSEGKRLFIKDIMHYLVPPKGQPVVIAPSLAKKKKGVGTEVHCITNGEMKTAPYPYDTAAEPGNPTVVPQDLLDKFHFTFLIRDPHSSIPSYYRCALPPLQEMTGWASFDPAEAGYNEIRRVFDYLRSIRQVGPHNANDWSGGNTSHFSPHGPPPGAEICVIDADDLLDDPEGVIEAFCKSTGLNYDPSMLKWDSEESQACAKKAFEKWKGFHEDAINSTGLRARTNKKKPKSEEEWDAEWKKKYGDEAAKLIRETVDANMADYEYLHQFVLKVQPTKG